MRREDCNAAAGTAGDNVAVSPTYATGDGVWSGWIEFSKKSALPETYNKFPRNYIHSNACYITHLSPSFE